MNKPKFNPIVTRVKLNPEQAVLACTCYGSGRTNTRATSRNATTICIPNRCNNNVCSNSSGTRNSST